MVRHMVIAPLLYFILVLSGCPHLEAPPSPSLPTSLTFSPDTLTLEAESKSLVSLIILPLEAREDIGSLEWNSSVPEVGSLRSDGTVEALSPGTTILSAFHPGSGLKALCLLTVTEKKIPATELSLEPGEVLLFPGDTLQLKPRILPVQAGTDGLVYTSQSPEIVHVTSDGWLSAKSSGEAKITARLGTLEAFSLIKVLEPPASVLPAPTLLPGGGEFTEDIEILAQTTAEGGVIRYTTDGSDPQEDSPIYPSFLPLAEDGASLRLKVRVFVPGKDPSPVRSADYFLNYPVLAPPVLSPAGGVIPLGSYVHFSTADGGPGEFRYTQDGTIPNLSSDLGDRFALERPTLLGVRGYRTGFKPSPPVWASFSPGAFSGNIPLTFRYVPEVNGPAIRGVKLRILDEEFRTLSEEPMGLSEGTWMIRVLFDPRTPLSVEGIAESQEGEFLSLEAGTGSDLAGTGSDLVDLRTRVNLPKSPTLIIGTNHVYAVGGWESSGEASSRVYMAALSDKGTLGPWKQNTSLPSPLAGGAGFLLGGWIHVMGGSTTLGFMAPVATDGTLGFTGSQGKKWEKSRVPLPLPRKGGQVLIQGDRLLWLGGNLDVDVLAPPWQARLWKDGQISPWYRNLPTPSYATVENKFLVPGGFLRISPSGIPGYFWDFLVPTATVPRIFPSQGFLAQGTKIKASLIPGDQLRFTRSLSGSPEEPTLGSHLFDPTSPPQPADGEIFRWKSFRSGGAPSQEVTTTWRVRSSGMFVLLAGQIIPSVSPEKILPISLVEKYSSGDTLDVPAVMYALSLSKETSLEFQWTGLTPQGQDPQVPVFFSLLEEDLTLPAWDKDGNNVIYRSSEEKQPVTTTLPPGKYYLRFERRDGNKGGSFTLVCQDRSE